MPDTLTSDDTKEMLAYVAEQFRDPECPKCGHSTSLHLSKFIGRNEANGVSKTISYCNANMHKERKDAIHAVVRITDEDCACDMRPDEILFNLNLRAAERARLLDIAADRVFAQRNMTPEEKPSTPLVVTFSNDGLNIPPVIGTSLSTTADEASERQRFLRWLISGGHND